MHICMYKWMCFSVGGRGDDHYYFRPLESHASRLNLTISRLRVFKLTSSTSVQAATNYSLDLASQIFAGSRVCANGRSWTHLPLVSMLLRLRNPKKKAIYGWVRQIIKRFMAECKELQVDQFYVSDEEEAVEARSGPSKHAKTEVSTYQTEFKPEWKKTWPFLQEVKKRPLQIFLHYL